jgi:RNA polymerase sigma-70 factor (ECF subfamily)
MLGATPQHTGATDAGSLGDKELVALARAGHYAVAFREIMRRYDRRLFRVARSVLRDDTEAEDAVQEAYLRAFQGLEAFRGEASLATWLTRIALNEALGRLRRRRTALGLELVEAAQREGGGARSLMFPTTRRDNPEDAAARDEVRRLLEAAIDALPEAFRVVLVARDVEGMSVEETAELLGRRPETVRTRLHRARRMLRAALDARLGDALRETFPFEGERCACLAERVLERLGLGGTLPPS